MTQSHSAEIYGLRISKLVIWNFAKKMGCLNKRAHSIAWSLGSKQTKKKERNVRLRVCNSRSRIF